MAVEWTLREPPVAAEGLASRLGVPPLVALALAGRGLADPEEARAFLQPQLDHLHDPSADPALVEAAGRLVAAARDGRPIVIYGDYDVDGMTASAILWQALRLAGANVRIYIPHRLDEGYGLNLDAVEQLAAEGAKVLVTVDCGVTSPAEVARARELGLVTIVTDHHEADPDRIPDADVLVDPKLPGSAYPFRDLAGAGVAFKLAWAIGKTRSPGERCTRTFRDFLLSATGLAALGTIADVVPLVGENHVLATFGLDALRGTRHPGLRALMRVAGLDGGKPLNAGHVAFGLAPRLNAAGRLGQAQAAIELLTTAGGDAATAIADQLDRQNRERQALERRIFDEARALAEQTFDPDRDTCLVLASEGWHTGVIGIVASRLVEAYYRPTFLIALDGDAAQGSGRSIPGFHLFEALTACQAHLGTFGGHAMAAGLRTEASRVEAFREAFAAHAAACLRPQDLVPRLTVDAEVRLADLTLETVQLLERLGPFGAGNPRPVFALKEARLASDARVMGRRGTHLQMHLTEAGRAVRAVAWNEGPAAETLSRAGSCGLAFTCRVSDFRGPPEVELHARDLWIGRYGDQEAEKEYA